MTPSSAHLEKFRLDSTVLHKKIPTTGHLVKTTSWRATSHIAWQRNKKDSSNPIFTLAFKRTTTRCCLRHFCTRVLKDKCIQGQIEHTWIFVLGECYAPELLPSFIKFLYQRIRHPYPGSTTDVWYTLTKIHERSCTELFPPYSIRIFQLYVTYCVRLEYCRILLRHNHIFQSRIL